MPFEPYKAGQAVDPSLATNTSVLKDKSVIVTGGASGLGLAYVRAFASHGAFVTFGDINATAGEKIASELGPNVQFVKCDVTSWSDQLAMFKAAVSNSPAKSCDIVVANAGIAKHDDVLSVDDGDEPIEPNLDIMRINGLAPLYTTKLALHYFARQPESPERDRCLIVKASLAGYLDLPGALQYNVSKWGMRGLVNNLRRTGWQAGVRVNLIAPWFIATPIMTKESVSHIKGLGVEFALEEDAASAVVRVACDKHINGRALGIVPRRQQKEGWIDLRHDDYKEGDFMVEWQEGVLRTSHRIRPKIEQPEGVGPEGFGSK